MAPLLVNLRTISLNATPLYRSRAATSDSSSPSKMVKAIRVHKAGGPEELKWEDVDVPEPGEGEVRIKHTVVGLNFIDIYFRKAIYPPPGKAGFFC